MNDKEFLQYCRTHCETPRAAFVPQQIARLMRMAGFPMMARHFDAMPNQVLDGFKDDVLIMLDIINART